MTVSPLAVYSICRPLCITYLVLSTVVIQASLPATASCQSEIEPVELIGDNLEEMYGWPLILLQLSAVAVTPVLVYSGADRQIQDTFQQQNPFGSTFADITLYAGSVTPIIAAGGLYLGAKADGNSELITAGSAAVQAVVLQFIIVTTLKWLTDRTGPYKDGDPEKRRGALGDFLRDSDDPTDFNFNPFDLSGGLRWPSGHTASHMALVSALVAFYPDQIWIALVGYPLVAAVAIGMVEGDAHWFSDIVAGAFIGHAIGWAVGRGFRSAYDQQLRDGLATSSNEPDPLLRQLSFSPPATIIATFRF